MRKPRDRRFGAIRRKLHYRLRVMEFEHEGHKRALHHGHFFECAAPGCKEALLYDERRDMLRDIIREFGGRA